MPKPFQQYVPNGVAEIVDHLGMMMLKSPTFKDDYFVGQNIETVFSALNEGLQRIRSKLGEERFSQAMKLSDGMKALFVADPDDKTESALAGREMILEMEALLIGRASGGKKI